VRVKLLLDHIVAQLLEIIGFKNAMLVLRIITLFERGPSQREYNIQMLLGVNGYKLSDYAARHHKIVKRHQPVCLVLRRTQRLPLLNHLLEQRWP
jgi:hypothetical protein